MGECGGREGYSGKCAFKWTADKVFLMRLNATTCHSAHGGMQNEAAAEAAAAGAAHHAWARPIKKLSDRNAEK